MKKNTNVLYDYNSDTNIATVIITDELGRTYCGNAFVHPDDLDMANEKTGLSIAFSRAQIKLFNAKRQDAKQRLKGFKQLYYTMKDSKHYNPKSYEARMLNRSIKRTQEEIDVFEAMITTTRQNISEYINKKEEFYKAIRKSRKGQK